MAAAAAATVRFSRERDRELSPNILANRRSFDRLPPNVQLSSPSREAPNLLQRSFSCFSKVDSATGSHTDLALESEEADYDPGLKPMPSVRARRTTKSKTAHWTLHPKTLGERRFPMLTRIVHSRRFEVTIGLIIVLNCFTMGVEAELLLGKAAHLEGFVGVSEHIFTALFLVELVLRIIVFGWQSFLPLFRSFWNFLDAMLVLVTGVLAVWILPLFNITSGSAIQTLTVLRAFRLVRLVRVVQRVQAFKEVWLLLRGLTESGRVLFWTIVVIFMITYMFAVFGVVLISVEIRDEFEEASAREGAPGVEQVELEALVTFTDGVIPLMYTLIQVLTLDSWTAIARPLMNYVTWSWAYFYLYISVAVIVTMNLVTAVIVDNALKNSQKDSEEQLHQREKERMREMKHCEKIFEQMDADGDGELTWTEFVAAFDEPVLCNKLMLLGIDPENCEEIFHLLDTGDGVLSVHEFFEGIARLEGPAQSKELLRTTKMSELLVKLVLQHSQEVQDDLGELLNNTRGAAARERPGTLRRRAKSQDLFAAAAVAQAGPKATTPARSSGRSSASSTGQTSPAASPAKSSRQSRTSPRATAPAEKQPTLDAVLRRLDEVAGMVVGLQGSVDACSRSVSEMGSELGSVKADLAEAVSRQLLPMSSWRRSPDPPPVRLPTP